MATSPKKPPTIHETTDSTGTPKNTTSAAPSHTLHIDVNHDIADQIDQQTQLPDVSLQERHFHFGWWGMITQPPSTTSPRSAASMRPCPGYP